ncbi:hypothetical protein ACWGQ9_06025 [Streptomyces parvus]
MTTDSARPSAFLSTRLSCEHNNGLLDRALLVGTPEDPSIGFFSDVLRS